MIALGRMQLGARARLVVLLVLLTNVAILLAGLVVFWLYENFRRDFVEQHVFLAGQISDVNTALAQVQIDLDDLIRKARLGSSAEINLRREGQKLLDRTVLLQPPALERAALGGHVSAEVYARFLSRVDAYRGYMRASVHELPLNWRQAEAQARRAASAALDVNQDAAQLLGDLHSSMDYDLRSVGERLLKVGLPLALAAAVLSAVVFFLIQRLAENMTRTVESLQSVLGRLRVGDVDVEIRPAAPTPEAQDLAQSLLAFRQTLADLAAARTDLAEQVKDRTQQLQDANRDLDQQVQQLRSTDKAMRLFKQIFDYTAEAIVVTDLEANIVDVNDAYVAVTGYSRDEVVGRSANVLKSGRHDEAFYRAMWHAILTQGGWSGEIWEKKRDGEIYPALHTINTIYDEQQRPILYVSVMSDITRLKQAEQQLEQLAYFDRLTGLPNRRLLLDRMEHALKLADRSRSYGAVFFLDLDHFKHVNDTLGHQIGDELLAEVARRVKTCVRSADTVGRLAGDEFVVLAEELSTHIEQAVAQAKQIGRKITEVLGGGYVLSGKVLHCSASVGVALFGGEEGGNGVEQLLSMADTAMYEAKKAGRGAVCLFEPAMWQDLQARVALESRLHEALREDRFFVVYQPVVDVRGQIVGVEALVRWDDGGRSVVPPAEFIPLAEETHLIVEIEKRVLEQVCHRLAQWAGQEQLNALPIAMNVSAVHFNHPDFVDTLARAIERHGVRPSLLKIELTESVVMKDVAKSVHRMRELQAMGIRLAMDDFGTGHSSLAYLRDLPFNQIKIDRSFVRHVEDEENDRFIVNSVLTLARFLQVEVIAEGVETESQRQALIAMGCQLFQGYLFSRPLPGPGCEDMVREGAMRSLTSNAPWVQT